MTPKNNPPSSAYEYVSLSPDETSLSLTVTRLVMTDENILAMVVDNHSHGDRCVCAAILDDQGRFAEGFVATEEAALEEFPFDLVRRAVQSYDMGSEVCIVLVRGRKVCATIGSSF